jgi:anti-sigma B factor antagonist
VTDTKALTVRVPQDQPDGVCLLELGGELGPDAADTLHAAVEDLYEAGHRRFVFDLSGLAYIGSLGLREFVRLASRVKGDGVVCLCELQPEVQSVFDLTRLAILITICGTRPDAIAAARSA